MHKKIISVIFAFALTLSLTACGKPDYSESFTDFEEAIDTEYGKEIIKNISSFGDDPVTGNRSAGSPAESQVLDYLKAEWRT